MVQYQESSGKRYQFYFKMRISCFCILLFSIKFINILENKPQWGEWEMKNEYIQVKGKKNSFGNFRISDVVRFGKTGSKIYCFHSHLCHFQLLSF